MKELKEIRFNETDVILNDNLVRGGILPEKIAELKRNIIFTGDTVVEGAIFGNRIEIRAGHIDVQGAAFAQKELYVAADAKGSVIFRKAVGSADSLVTRSASCPASFLSDINAKSVTLCNAYVAGSIYADEISLENCVVVGGVFATQNIELKHSMVGTFNAPAVHIAETNYLLLPSAFSIDPLQAAPKASLVNLTLADLGDAFRGKPQADDSGKIVMSLASDTVKATLTDEEHQHTLRSYTVAGKVLAADLVDSDRFQNHFLLSAAALGTQLLRAYDMGKDKNGKPLELSPDTLRKFFFDILDGRIEIRTMDGSFRLADLAK